MDPYILLVRQYPETLGVKNAVSRQTNELTFLALFRRLFPMRSKDFNLLELEVLDRHAEKDYFASNPHLGKFVHYPIFGDIVGPDTVPSALLKTMAVGISVCILFRSESF